MAPYESGLEVHQPPETTLPEHYVPSQEKMFAGYGSVGQSDNIPLAQKDEGGAGDAWRQEDHFGDREAGRPQRILGMTPFLFGLVVALGTAVIVGGAVGGGIGSQLKSVKNSLSACISSQQDLSSCNTTVPTSTTRTTFATTTGGLLLNYTVAAPTSVASVPVDCPNLGGNIYTTKQAQTYAISCTNDEHGGDFVAVVAYTYEDCIKACSTVN